MSGVSRDARRCALQAIYQFDAVGDADAERIRVVEFERRPVVQQLVLE